MKFPELNRAHLLLVQTKLSEKVMLLDHSVHPLEQGQQRVLSVKQHLALSLILGLLQRRLPDAGQGQQFNLLITGQFYQYFYTLGQICRQFLMGENMF